MEELRPSRQRRINRPGQPPTIASEEDPASRLIQALMPCRFAVPCRCSLRRQSYARRARRLFVALLGVGAGNLRALFVDGFDDVVIGAGRPSRLLSAPSELGVPREGVGVVCRF